MNQATEDAWTILRLLQWTATYLEEKDSESARLDAEILLAHVRKCPRIQLYTEFDQVATEHERAEFKALVQRRASGEPVAYLVGKKEFYSRDFEVTCGVLVPRADTETVVVEALEWISSQESSQPMRIADLGTGSGILAITIALEYALGTVVATDIEPDAIEVARRNAARYGLADRIEFHTGPFFCNLPGNFDLVVSNPPYVSEGEYADLPPTIREYEPRTALVAGPQGTECVEKLLDEAADKVRPGGACVVEISPMIETGVAQIIDDRDGWKLLKVAKDHGGLSRVVVIERST